MEKRTDRPGEEEDPPEGTSWRTYHVEKHFNPANGGIRWRIRARGTAKHGEELATGYVKSSFRLGKAIREAVARLKEEGVLRPGAEKRQPGKRAPSGRIANKKEHILLVRWTTAQWNRLVEQAEAAGLSRPEYVRQSLFPGSRRPR